MSPSPNVTINNQSMVDGVSVNPGQEVTIQLLDLTGVNSWSIKCLTTDDQNSAAVVTAGLVIDNVNKSAVFTAPGNARGSALIFESKINNGVDLNGKLRSDYIVRFGVFAIGTSGLRLIALNQKTEGNSQFGWLEELNSLLAMEGTGNATSIAGSLIGGTPS